MKTRNGFVTNSSSTSFIIAAKKDAAGEEFLDFFRPEVLIGGVEVRGLGDAVRDMLVRYFSEGETGYADGKEPENIETQGELDEYFTEHFCWRRTLSEMEPEDMARYKDCSQFLKNGWKLKMIEVSNHGQFIYIIRALGECGEIAPYFKIISRDD